MSLYVHFIIFIFLNNYFIKSQPITTGQNNIGVTEESFLEYWYIRGYDLEFKENGKPNIVDQNKVEKEINNNYLAMYNLNLRMHVYEDPIDIQTYINNFINVRQQEIGTNNLGVTNESFYEFIKFYQIELSRAYFKKYNMILQKDKPFCKKFMEEELVCRFEKNKKYDNIQDYIDNLNAVKVLETGYNKIHVRKDIYKSYIDTHKQGLMKAFEKMYPENNPVPHMIRNFFENEILSRYNLYIRNYKSSYSLETFLNRSNQTIQELNERKILREERAKNLAIVKEVAYDATCVPPELDEFDETKYNYEEANDYIKFQNLNINEETSSSSKRKTNKEKEKLEE